MKGNGPNSPQTVRGLLNRRNQRAILDTRAHQEADILMAPMAAPFGKGFHKLTTPAGTEYTVGDASGMTFAPNAQVMVANPGGLGHRSVLGKAPPNRNGGAARTRNPRRRGTVVLESNQYAFGSDGVSLDVATLYADGTYVSTRGTISSIPGTITGCILSDSSALVGDGSALIHDTSSLKVWDVEGGVTYSYSVPSGWVNQSALAYSGGYLYWVEFEDIEQADGDGAGEATFDYRLRRSATDLTGVTTITTATSDDASVYDPPFIVYDEPAAPWVFAVDADGAVLYIGFKVTENINHEILEWHGVQARFSLSGGAPSTREWTLDELKDSIDTTPPSAGGARSATRSVSFAICMPEVGVHSVLVKSDDASVAATDLWGVSDLDTLSYVSAFSVGTLGSLLQVYGESGAVGKIFRGTTSGVLVTAVIEAFDGTNYPTALFYFGE